MKRKSNPKLMDGMNTFEVVMTFADGDRQVVALIKMHHHAAAFASTCCSPVEIVLHTGEVSETVYDSKVDQPDAPTRVDAAWSGNTTTDTREHLVAKLIESRTEAIWKRQHAAFERRLAEMNNAATAA
jgi:hypothetical protein